MEYKEKSTKVEGWNHPGLGILVLREGGIKMNTSTFNLETWDHLITADSVCTWCADLPQQLLSSALMSNSFSTQATAHYSMCLERSLLDVLFYFSVFTLFERSKIPPYKNINWKEMGITN